MLERVVFKRQGRICLSLSCVENDMLKGRSPARYTNYFSCFCYYDLGLGGFVVLVWWRLFWNEGNVWRRERGEFRAWTLNIIKLTYFYMICHKKTLSYILMTLLHVRILLNYWIQGLILKNYWVNTVLHYILRTDWFKLKYFSTDYYSFFLELNILLHELILSCNTLEPKYFFK